LKIQRRKPIIGSITVYYITSKYKSIAMKNELIILLLTLGVGYTIYRVSNPERAMEQTKEKAKKKDIKRELKTDPRTGMPILSGSPSFTKEDIAKDFPDDSDRDSVIIRRSVGL
jgi:hypothetical protein